MYSAVIPVFCQRLAVRVLFAFSLLPAITASGQQSVHQVSDQEVVKLSPFIVDSTGDVGYVAENTLSGSRLNSSLKETPGSVSVFTKEFLDDIGVLSLGDILDYSVNSEINTEQDLGGDGQNQMVTSVHLTPRVVNRGIVASQAHGLFFEHYTHGSLSGGAI